MRATRGRGALLKLHVAPGRHGGSATRCAILKAFVATDAFSVVYLATLAGKVGGADAHAVGGGIFVAVTDVPLLHLGWIAHNIKPLLLCGYYV